MPPSSESYGSGETQEIRIGPNHLTLTGDVVMIQDQQSWEGAEMRELLELFTQVRAKYGHIYIISYVQSSGTADADARRLFGQWYREHDIALVALVGAGMAIRGMVALLQGAVRIFSKRQMNIHFYATLEDAQAAVAAARHKNVRVDG